MIVCVIPARGGSKRIPRKNIRDFCGQPMISWSIRTALEAGVFDRVIVSTDDDEIEAVARNHGAEVPFRRPPELSDDMTGTNAVVAHASTALAAAGDPVDLVCCLYPTAPLVRSDDLLGGRDAFECADDADFCFAATTFAFPVHRSLTIDERGFVHPLFPEHIGARSQDLPDAIHDAGAFYWGAPTAFQEHPTVFEARAVAHLLPRNRVQDIDTPEDWTMAQILFERQRGADGSARS